MFFDVTVLLVCTFLLTLGCGMLAACGRIAPGKAYAVIRRTGRTAGGAGGEGSKKIGAEQFGQLKTMVPIWSPAPVFWGPENA